MLMVLRYCKPGYDEEGAPAPPIPILFTEVQKEAARRVQALVDMDSPDPAAWDLNLHALFKALFFSIHPEIDRTADQDPVSILLMLINLGQHTGTFPQCGVISQCLAGLTHAIRLIACKHVVEERKNDTRDDALLKYVTLIIPQMPLLMRISLELPGNSVISGSGMAKRQVPSPLSGE